jgi:hypothetical protein
MEALESVYFEVDGFIVPGARDESGPRSLLDRLIW